jgi:hypothetical protein
MASYEIKDVVKLIADQEWKMKHYTNTSRLLMLAIIGSMVLGLLISILHSSCCNCKCCRKMLAKICEMIIVDLLCLNSGL